MNVYHLYRFASGELRTYANKLQYCSAEYLGETNEFIDIWNPFASWPKIGNNAPDGQKHVYEAYGVLYGFKRPKLPTYFRNILKINAIPIYKGLRIDVKKSKAESRPGASIHYVIPAIFCCYCEDRLAHAKGEIHIPSNAKTREHVIPKHKGGKIIKWACRDCNTEKGGLMLHSYIQMLNMKLMDNSGEELKKLQTKIKNANKIAIEISVYELP